MKPSDMSDYALSFCAVATMLAGCGGLQPPIGAPGAMPQSRAVAMHASRRAPIGEAQGGNPNTLFLITNKSSRTIHFNGAVEPPKGEGGCPWVLYFPAFPGKLASGQTGPGMANILSYNLTCSPLNEPRVWSFSYGTNLSRSQTICAWDAVYAGAATGLTFSVKNARRTNCSVGYDSTSGIEYFYYDSAPGR